MNAVFGLNEIENMFVVVPLDSCLFVANATRVTICFLAICAAHDHPFMMSESTSVRYNEPSLND